MNRILPAVGLLLMAFYRSAHERCTGPSHCLLHDDRYSPRLRCASTGGPCRGGHCWGSGRRHSHESRWAG